MSHFNGFFVVFFSIKKVCLLRNFFTLKRAIGTFSFFGPHRFCCGYAIQTQSPLPLAESRYNEPSKECIEKKFREEWSFGPSSGIVCNCVQNMMPVWTLSCVNTNKKNATCAATNYACDVLKPLNCCGNRRCSNGRCRLVSQGINDKRMPLLAKGNDRSLGTIRGAHNVR